MAEAFEKDLKVLLCKVEPHMGTSEAPDLMAALLLHPPNPGCPSTERSSIEHTMASPPAQLNPQQQHSPFRVQVLPNCSPPYTPATALSKTVDNCLRIAPRQQCPPTDLQTYRPAPLGCNAYESWQWV